MNIPEFKFALHEDLQDNKEFLPTKSEPNATGWDVRAALDEDIMVLYPGEKFLIPLGIRCIIPEGWWLELRPRSSTFAKKDLNCLYGVIDQDYANMIYLSCQYQPEISECLEISFGEKLGQIIPVKRQEMVVSEISNEEFDKLVKERNAVRQGGLGSTGDR